MFTMRPSTVLLVCHACGAAQWADVPQDDEVHRRMLDAWAASHRLPCVAALSGPVTTDEGAVVGVTTAPACYHPAAVTVTL